MKKRIILALISICVVALYVLYYFGIPAILNTKKVSDIIQDVVRKESGLSFVIQAPKYKMGYLPSVWIKADKLYIEGTKDSPFLIKNPKLKIALFPLFVQKLHILNFSCSSMNIDLMRDKSNLFYLGDNLLLKLSKPKLSLEGAIVNIKDYTIDFEDRYISKTMCLKGKKFILHEFNPDSKIDFSTDSILLSQGSKASVNARVQLLLPFNKTISSKNFVIDGDVKNFNLNVISPYILNLTKSKVSQIAGIVDLKAKTENIAISDKRLISTLSIKNGFINLDKNTGKIVLPEKFVITSKLDFLNKNLTINQLNIVSDTINADISGTVHDVAASNPNLDIKVKIFDTLSETVISALPIFELPDLDIAALKKYSMFSNVEASLDIKGQAQKPAVYGDLIFKNVYINKPLNIPKATIKLSFTGKRLKLDVLVPASSTEKVTVKGDMSLYEKDDVFLEIISTQNVNLATTETVLLPLHEILKFPLGPLPVMDVDGLGNINLKITGGKKSPHLYGTFNFNNANVAFNDIHNCLITNGSGSLKFDDTKFYFLAKTANLFSKPINIEGSCDIEGRLNFYVTLLNSNLNKLLQILKTSPMLADFKKNVDLIEATSGNVSLKLNLKGTAKDMSDFVLNKNIDVIGDIKLLGNSVIVKGYNVKIKNLLGNIHFKNDEFYFDLYPITSGNKRCRVNGKKIGDKFYSKLKLDKLNFVYNKIPILFSTGLIDIDGNKVSLKKINGIADSKPFFIDGSINNIVSNPTNPVVNIYMTSKIRQYFIDKYFNNHNIYPLITKGDISYAARANGTLNDIDLKSNIWLTEDSSIYYLGAMIGDSACPINLAVDMNVKNRNVFNIKNFQYDKHLKHSTIPQLNAKGIIDCSNKDNVKFKNLRIKTFVPTDAKIFNLIFKKIFIKKGTFDANLLVDGAYPRLKILGKLNLDNIDIPFLDTTIKDIDLNFKDKNVDFTIIGEFISQVFNISGSAENKLTPPYVINNTIVSASKIDLNHITRKINNIEIESTMTKIAPNKASAPNLTLRDFVINKMVLKAKTLVIRDVIASNFYAKFSFKDSELKLNDYLFNIAEGNVSGDFSYNIKNHKTALDMHIKNVNANAITNTLLGLRNQLYGSLNGELSITCNGATEKDCMRTLNGNGGFRVVNGRMPKLGSLEYLLKAANLVKSGLTGLTLNSLIDLISPLKTGEFENINGLFEIHSGVAKDIQIFSKGKALSIYISGDYNCYDSVADLQIFGKVAKKTDNPLGIVGNTSINTLFNLIPGVNLDKTSNALLIKNINKIPGIELNDKSYRIFNATVKGDLNSENYVQSFRWLE